MQIVGRWATDARTAVSAGSTFAEGSCAEPDKRFRTLIGSSEEAEDIRMVATKGASALMVTLLLPVIPQRI